MVLAAVNVVLRINLFRQNFWENAAFASTREVRRSPGVNAGTYPQDPASAKHIQAVRLSSVVAMAVPVIVVIPCYCRAAVVSDRQHYRERLVRRI